MEDTLPDSGPQCSICLQELLPQAACALRCGHVFHASCCQEWINKGNSNCPQCKKTARIEQLRILEFEVAEVPWALDDVQRLQQASAEEREQLHQKLTAELAEIKTELHQASEELEGHRDAASESKRARRELESKVPHIEAELKELRAEKESKVLSNASLCAQVDSQNNRQRQSRNRIWSQSRGVIHEDDPDAREEKRKLRTMRPSDRARQLHDAVVSARQQEVEINRIALERERALQELDEELVRVTRLEQRLRRELSESLEGGRRHRSETSSSSKVAESTASAAAVQPLKVEARAQGASRSSAQTSQSQASGEGEDEDMLYSALPVRRGHGGVARLFGAPAKTTPKSQVASFVATPSRRPNCLQVLFSKKQL
mmetsp:Transcript_18097/g.35526  ORF Transcript_18097/g.35526 Transcript_18097/m.35526 type:complete len:374 (-) Transcript_18097:110-1231(-)